MQISSQQPFGEPVDEQLFWTGGMPSFAPQDALAWRGREQEQVQESTPQHISDCLQHIMQAEQALQVARRMLTAFGAHDAVAGEAPIVNTSPVDAQEPIIQARKSSEDRPNAALSAREAMSENLVSPLQVSSFLDQIVLDSGSKDFGREKKHVEKALQNFQGVQYIGEQGHGSPQAYQKGLPDCDDEEAPVHKSPDAYREKTSNYVLAVVGEGTTETGEKDQKYLIDINKAVWVRCWGSCHLPVFHPDSIVRLIWNMTGFLFVIFEAFLIPFYLAFDYEPQGLMMVFISTVNVFFICDIIFSFLTGVIQHNLPVFCLKRIAISYLTTWFVADVLSGIPWEWIDMSNSGGDSDDDTGNMGDLCKALRFIKALRLLRITRLLHLMKLGSFSTAIEIVIESNRLLVFSAGVLRVLFLLFGVTHWAACYWYIVGTNAHDGDDDNWIIHNIEGVQDIGKRYIYSLYFTLTTMTTVGYGDITATNLSEVKFVLALLLIASIVFAGLMGALTDLISNLNNDANERNSKKAALSRYMRWRAVPKNLFMEIREHLLFLWEKNEFDEAYEDELKEQLSPALKKELCYHIFGPMLRHAPFLGWLKGCEVCVKELATKVVTIFLVKGDNLFRVGELNENIYMLLRGTLYLSKNEKLELTQGMDDSQRTEKNEFKIPRNKESSMADVFNMVLSSVKQSFAHRLSQGEAHGPQDTKQMQQLANLFKDQHLNLTDENLEEETDEDRAAPLDDLTYNIDSRVLLYASKKLQRNDLRLKQAATYIQRRWRRNHGKSALAGAGGRSRSIERKSKGFQSRWVHAPAYLGESCLWEPLSQWDSEQSILKTYAAKAESRVELAYFTRSAVQETLELFSPWLRDRFEYFQKTVRECMEQGQQPSISAAISLCSLSANGSPARSEVAARDKAAGSGAAPSLPRQMYIPISERMNSGPAAFTPSEKCIPRATPTATPRGAQLRSSSMAGETPYESASLPSTGRYRNAAAAALARVHLHVTPPPGLTPRTMERMSQAMDTMRSGSSLKEPLLPSPERRS